jgi:hypothetical protein
MSIETVNGGSGRAFCACSRKNIRAIVSRKSELPLASATNRAGFTFALALLQHLRRE